MTWAFRWVLTLKSTSIFAVALILAAVPVHAVCKPATLDLLSATNALQPLAETFVDGYLLKLRSQGTAGKKTTVEASAEEREMLLQKVRDKWCEEAERKFSAREIEFLTKLHRSSVMKKFSESEIKFWETKSLHEYLAEFYPAP